MAHRRYDPLRDEWVLVSPNRTARPWQGEVADGAHADVPDYEPSCYLCPGNARAGENRNPAYDGVFVFENDYPALTAASEIGETAGTLLRSEPVQGRCDVICYSPRHDLSFGGLTDAGRRSVIDAWADLTTELSEDHPVVQIFENRGEMMGASSPHPHGQVWSLDALPTEIHKEVTTQRRHFEAEGSPLLIDALHEELDDGSRVLVSSDHWTVVVPHWAVWPFETLVLPHRPVGDVASLESAERDDLSAVLGTLIRTYDRLFDTSFPYSMGIHQAPVGDATGWTLHMHFKPPLLRSATVRKHMVGFEMFGEPQRDLTPEQAAELLRGAADGSEREMATVGIGSAVGRERMRSRGRDD